MARDRGIPELCDWDTIQIAADKGPGRVQRNDRRHSVAGEAEGSAGENAQVLKEDGEFAACEAGVV